MKKKTRKSGVDVIGNVPWGTHVCFFSETAADQIEIFVPYLQAGLSGNELCIWITSHDLTRQDAEKALKASIPHAGRYLKKGQIRIIPSTRWYMRRGLFDPERVFNLWKEKIDLAAAGGYDGLRLACSLPWSERKEREKILAYEKDVDSIIDDMPVIALCNYSLGRYQVPDVIDLVNNHRYTLVKKEGSWSLSENVRYRSALKTIRKREKRLKHTLEAGNLGTWELDLKTRKIMKSLQLDRIFGCEGDGPDRTSRNYFEQVLPEDAEKVSRILTLSFDTGRPWDFECRIRRPDNEIRWIWSQGKMQLDSLKRVRYMNGTIQDITDRKRVEEKLYQSEEFNRRIIQSSIDCIKVLDLEGNILSMSEGGQRMLELDDVSPLLNTSFIDFWEEDVKPRVRAAIDTAIAGGIGGFDASCPSRKGKSLWCEVIIIPMNGSDGHPERLLCISRDMTERRQTEEELHRHREHLESLVEERTAALEEMNALLKEEVAERTKAEAALAESEKKYRMVIENANESILIAQDGKVKFVNRRTTAFMDYTEEEMMSVPFTEFIHPDDRALVLENHYRRVRGEDLPDTYNFRVLDRRGNVRWVIMNSTLVSWNGRPATLSFLMDITDRIKAEEEKKKIEDRLYQAQKMEALGRFAGGIAHDLNNILYPIIIDTETILLETEEGSRVHQLSEEALRAAYRQRDLVKQILSFSRRNKQVFVPVSISSLLNETLGFLRALLPVTVEIHERIGALYDTVMGDPTQIQQVIMNLMRNAADALDDQMGTIEISLTNDCPDPEFSGREHAACSYVRLAVRDTGCGMKPEVVDRIFEPFFTTKAEDKGSGMGLAVVHGILKSHGGIITVESEPGKGSQFSLYFPACGCDGRIESFYAGDRSEKDEPDRLYFKDREKIMLVDDEELVLTSLSRMLRKNGYLVVAMKDGMKALDLFRRDPQSFDLVITDMTMPIITGSELAQKILEIRPEMPIIISTGFSDIIDENALKAMGIRDLIMKPAGISELQSAVVRALDN